MAGGKMIWGDFYWIIFHNKNTCYQKPQSENIRHAVFYKYGEKKI